MNKYIFVTAYPDDLGDEVNNRRRKGYIPLGGPIVLSSQTNQWGRNKVERIGQAMILEEKKGEQAFIQAVLEETDCEFSPQIRFHNKGE